MTFRDYSRRVRSELELGGIQVVVLADVDSTNAFCRRLIRTISEDAPQLRPTVVLAWSQSAGRGRLGRRWESARGLGIYLSLLLPPAHVRPLELGLLPLVVGVGACQAIRTVAPATGLKWPNDLVVEHKKLGGILIETVALGTKERAVIVGVGVNHGQLEEQLPTPHATSLAIAARSRSELPEMGVVAARIAEGLLVRVEAPVDRSQVLTAYRKLSVHQPGDRLRCRVRDRLVDGEFRGFDEHGHLLLRGNKADEVDALVAGEIIEDVRT